MTLRKRYWVVGVALSCLLLLKYETSTSNVGFPAPGNSGDPTSTPPGLTCGQCHAGGIKSAAGKAEILINDTVSVDSLKYRPGQTYKVTFRQLVSAARYGFQLSALTPANENAGTFTRTDLNKTELLPGAPPKSIKYISHQSADTTRVWSFNWTAPASETGVTFYYSFIASNASDSNDGDTVYAGTKVIQADTTFNSITEFTTLTDVSVYPNPVKGALYIQSHTLSGERADVALYSIAGDLVRRETFGVAASNIVFDITDVPVGIYLLQVKAGDKQATIKVAVQ